MTARLGSEYRYFGKLVLVPFRYFSIDTYRNIDIFDNTRVRRLRNRLWLIKNTADGLRCSNNYLDRLITNANSLSASRRRLKAGEITLTLEVCAR